MSTEVHAAKQYDEHILKIRALNDAHRKRMTQVCFAPGAQWVLDNWNMTIRFLDAVRRFEDFTEDNDPHGEHDMGFFSFDGGRYFFKFDYYDLTLNYHSEDPSDPAVTKRILTIGAAEDY